MVDTWWFLKHSQEQMSDRLIAVIDKIMTVIMNNSWRQICDRRLLSQIQQH